MKFSLYSGKQQKERIDETLERLMTKAGWTQSFKAEFIRIGLGYASVVVALFVYYLEKTTKFRDTRWIVGGLCVVYFVISYLSWLWKRNVERDAIYIGTKGNNKVWISTTNKSNTDEFELKVTKDVNGVQEMSHFSFKFPEIVDKRAVVHGDKLAEVMYYIDGKKMN